MINVITFALFITPSQRNNATAIQQPSKMEPSIFDIPLLIEEIAQYLYTRDIAHCVLVCKGWSTSFTPPLWRTIDLNRSISTKVLIQRREYIRAIYSFEKYEPIPPPSPPIEFSPFNLRTLQYDSFLGQRDGTTALQLVASAASLHSLTFKSFSSEKSFVDLLITTLESHRSLKKLDILFRRFDNPMDYRRLFQACRRLYSLRCNIIHMSHWRVGPEGVQDSDRQLNLVRDGISKIDDTQLQELLIEAHDSSLEIVVVLPLLEHSPLLERLELPYIHYDDTLSKIAHILGDKGRSRLKHLKLGYLVEEEKGLHDLFRVTGSESSSDINGFTGSNDGLQLLETETLNGFNRKLIEFLPRYFSKSLTVLNMDKSGLPIHLLAEGLNRLPNLKSLRTGVAFGVIEAESDLDSTFQTSWNCLGLTKLDFRVHCDGDSHRNYNPDWRESKEHRILEYLFSQIDRLTKLEEWSLESSMHVLALDNGYLGQLAGLTQLRVLDLSLYRGQLSTKNAKWMIEHWTRLSRFEVSRSFIPGWSPASDKVRPHNSVIKELQSRRPWIQIVFGDIEI